MQHWEELPEINLACVILIRPEDRGGQRRGLTEWSENQSDSVNKHPARTHSVKGRRCDCLSGSGHHKCNCSLQTAQRLWSPAAGPKSRPSHSQGDCMLCDDLGISWFMSSALKIWGTKVLGSTMHLLKLPLSLFSLKATLGTQNTDFAPKSPLSMSGHLKRGVSFLLKGGTLIRG